VETIFDLRSHYQPEERLEPLSAEEERGLKGDIREALSFLKEREADILTLRFGLNDWKKKTLREVGKKYGVSWGRVRQIESRAFRKLRHPRVSRLFRKYFPPHP